MSGFVPEKRMDKTGKLVTRHIRYGTQQASPKKNFPSVFGQLGRDERFPGETKKLLDAGLIGVSPAELKKLMLTLNDDTMRALHAVGVGANADTYTQDSAFIVLIRVCAQEGSFSLLNNVAFFAHDGDRKESAVTIAALIGRVKGLIMYQDAGTKRIDYTRASEQELDEARTLLAVGFSLRYTGGGCIKSDYEYLSGKGDDYLPNKELVAIFREAGKEVSLEMAEFVKAHDIRLRSGDDARNMAELFNMRAETHNALDEGVL